jgi:hypothetical protein
MFHCIEDVQVPGPTAAGDQMKEQLVEVSLGLNAEFEHSYLARVDVRRPAPV